jgi:hypothetical protein
MGKLIDTNMLRLECWDYADGKNSYSLVRVSDISAITPHQPRPVVPLEEGTEAYDAQQAQLAEEKWMKTDVLLKNGRVVNSSLTITGVMLRLEKGNPGGREA